MGPAICPQVGSRGNADRHVVLSTPGIIASLPFPSAPPPPPTSLQVVKATITDLMEKIGIPVNVPPVEKNPLEDKPAVELCLRYDYLKAADRQSIFEYVSANGGNQDDALFWWPTTSTVSRQHTSFRLSPLRQSRRPPSRIS